MSNATLQQPVSMSPTVPTSFLLDDGNSAVASFNVIQVHGDTGISTSLGTSNQIVLNVVTDSFKWSEKNANFMAEVQKGYFCNDALTATLPTTIGPPALVLGNTIIFYVDVNLPLPGSPLPVTIQTQSDQRIEVGGVISALGGTATARVQGSMLGLVFKLSDLTWHAIESMGSWTVV